MSSLALTRAKRRKSVLGGRRGGAGCETNFTGKDSWTFQPSSMAEDKVKHGTGEDGAVAVQVLLRCRWAAL